MEDIKCLVCLETDNEDRNSISRELTHTICQHIFHTTCLSTWIQHKNTCPTCRKPEPNIELYRQINGYTEPHKITIPRITCAMILQEENISTLLYQNPSWPFPLSRTENEERKSSRPGGPYHKEWTVITHLKEGTFEKWQDKEERIKNVKITNKRIEMKKLEWENKNAILEIDITESKYMGEYQIQTLDKKLAEREHRMKTDQIREEKLKTRIKYKIRIKKEKILSKEEIQKIIQDGLNEIYKEEQENKIYHKTKNQQKIIYWMNQ